MRKHFRFQFTRPRGARQNRLSERVNLAKCFNSRAREGRDGAYGAYGALVALFQFTRPRGARLD